MSHSLGNFVPQKIQWLKYLFQATLLFWDFGQVLAIFVNFYILFICYSEVHHSWLGAHFLNLLDIFIHIGLYQWMFSPKIHYYIFVRALKKHIKNHKIAHSFEPTSFLEALLTIFKLLLLTLNYTTSTLWSGEGLKSTFRSLVPHC